MNTQTIIAFIVGLIAGFALCAALAFLPEVEQKVI